MKNLIFGITGEMGSGKSTLTEHLKTHMRRHNTELKVIELDVLRRYALATSTEPQHLELRKNLISAFGLHSTAPDYFIDRSHLSSLIFNSAQALAKFSFLATPVLKADVKNIITQKSSESLTSASSELNFFCIVWAQLLEEGYEEFINTFVLISHCPAQIRAQRLRQAVIDIGQSEVEKRNNLIGTFSSKVALAQLCMRPYTIVDNSMSNGQDSDPVNDQKIQSINSLYHEQIKKITNQLLNWLRSDGAQCADNHQINKS